MHIGRPKGYIPPPPGMPPPPGGPGAPQQGGQIAPHVLQQVAAAAAGTMPSTVLLLNNILPAGQLRKQEDRDIVSGEGGEGEGGRGEGRGEKKGIWHVLVPDLPSSSRLTVCVLPVVVVMFCVPPPPLSPRTAPGVLCAAEG